LDKGFGAMMASLDQDDLSADSFPLFRRLVPPDLVQSFDAGHAGIFSSWVVVWLMTFQRLHQNAALSRAVAELKLGPISHHLPDCKRAREGEISPNTGGYAQARSDLPVEAAARVADHVFSGLVADRAPVWGELRLFLLDGTTLSLGHYPELLERFPPAENQHGRSHWPVVNLVTAHELASGLATRPEWGAMYGPQAVSETRLACRVLERLGGPAIILGDRNFGIFAVAWDAVSLGHGVIFRLKDDRFERMVAEASEIGPGQWRLSWRPSRWDRAANPDLPADAVVEGRLIEVTVEHDGRRIVLRLFTTDLAATPEEVATAYGLRWRVEGDIKDVKRTLQMHCLDGRGVDMIAKEILLGVVAYNLVIQVRWLAARRGGIEPRRLSFKRILDLVQAFCEGSGACADPAEMQERYETMIDAASRCRLPARKRFRSYPREVIPRTRGFPSRKKNSVHKN
jgi:putative transposase